MGYELERDILYPRPSPFFILLQINTHEEMKMVLLQTVARDKKRRRAKLPQSTRPNSVYTNDT
jgi:hypothetical protein